MNLSTFKASLAADAPPADLSLPLQALWYEAKGDWAEAHRLAQQAETAEGSWVHAYLHRVEGDLSNARYWYTRAGRPPSTQPLQEEWAAIARALLEGSGA